MSETTVLDKTRRYLRPVAATIISDDPDGVHLAVYSWLEMFGEWATGPGLCGESMRQGPLPEGTAVTCRRCEEWRPRYERYLAPGYRPEDDDPELLRTRLQEAQAENDRLRERLRLVTDEKVAYVAGPTIELLCAEINSLKAEVEAARKFGGEMRNFCSPHAVAAGYADQLEQAMDRAKGTAANATADALAAEMHRRVKRMKELKRGNPARDHVYGEVLGLRGAIGIALGAQVPGGSADVAGIDYYEAWVARQEGVR